MVYSRRIIKAVELAYEWHGEQRRKSTDIPYMTHLFAVAALVGEHGGDENQFIAALLHDSVEDSGGKETLGRIREHFGDLVADWVWGCSDSHTQPKPPWRERKEKHLEVMRNAPPELKLILAADKLHNTRSLALSYRLVGSKIWDRFNGGKEGTLWYHRSAFSALRYQWDHSILIDLAAATEALFALE
ncbi:MAG TPA: HD domain-containing protein [Candidatus Hydrogenedentes bacterium]|nr:HD domain-containing protein [Candidatus Hydrogenedentota bacterium]